MTQETYDDPEYTDLMDGRDLRMLQAREIRRMLQLPPDATHERVLRALYEIGQTDKRIDTALPRRYQGNIWVRR